MPKLDYGALGLKVGLEIHVQLDTGRKLFCHCRPELKNTEPDFRIVRRLRPAMSELSAIDPAALWEFRKMKTIMYEGYNDVTCLVELDEEPPHEPDEESLLLALAISKAFNAKIFDEIYVMRKVVIDGSNVSGFQRTMVVAHDGLAVFPNYKVPIWTISLEEDAARKVKERGDLVVYRLDRLGIPLIEVSTGPMEYPPASIAEVAWLIGRTIMNTRRTKRGLGSIRQDLNISIAKGAKTEVKGVPELSLIPKVIELEVLRQVNLLKIRDELINRGLSKDQYTPDLVDVTEVFSSTKSNIVRKTLEAGGVVAALKTPGLRGLLGFELQPGRRFGSELADRVRAWTRLGGLIHSDELPGYGISGEEVSKVAGRLGTDSFILLMGPPGVELQEAAKVIVNRVREAFDGVPEETRAAREDGTTYFMRPRPGAARMYPETDLRPIRVTIELLAKADMYVPEPIDRQIERYASMGMSRELARQLAVSEYSLEAEELMRKYKGRVNPTLIASIFVNTIKGLGRGVEQVDVVKAVDELLALYADGKITREAIQDVLQVYVEEDGRRGLVEIINEKSLWRMQYSEVLSLVKSMIDNGVKDRNKLMSSVMRSHRGRVDSGDLGRAIDELLGK
ncbi:Glu-tRNA(Gln) amidotransferase subunit GatE [Caldivirga sp. MU80]|uniref:Glu-tRNA(Gln) amidotransferase subunit GatE n=1 Tax=Caldivirga sp. MU80 TaxID=1650354 RepID=UPI0008369A7F|nr:Glu-tRNA(Gln) amidotransferase subunit GatE [Caldivirga sp. MU80]